METRTRTVALSMSVQQREAVTESGIISGTLATDGEASDGDILDIAGGVAKAGIPLLFGHDTTGWDTLRNLGSWTSFAKSDHAIDGTAKIELGGEGAGADFRKDVAHMIGQGHISALSIRWEPTKPPVRRVNLSADHPAYVNDATEKDPRKRYGMYFPAWRALEGSVVTLGADKAALIARAEGPTEANALWRDVLRSQWMPITPEMRDDMIPMDLTARYGRTLDQLAQDMLDRLAAGEQLAEPIEQDLLRTLFGADIPSLDDEAQHGVPGATPQSVEQTLNIDDVVKRAREQARASLSTFTDELREHARSELAKFLGK